MSDGDMPPYPTYTVEISIGACDWERLVEVLDDTVRRVKNGTVKNTIWGGAGTHGHARVVHRQEVTDASYKAALSDWRDSTQADSAKGAR